MRADAIDVDIDAHRFRILCDDLAAAASVRGMLAHHVTDEPAPVGFVLREPTDRQRFHLLTDRSGHVLARTRTTDEALAVLSEHLGAFLPPPAGTVRLAGRVVLRNDGTAVLACAPLLIADPPIERKLASIGARVVDRAVIDLHLDATIELTTSPWAVDAPRLPAGHAPTPSRSIPVASLLVADRGPVPATRLEIAARVAAATQPTATRQDVLSLAGRLVRGDVAGLRPGDRSAIYSALT